MNAVGNLANLKEEVQFGIERESRSFINLKIITLIIPAKGEQEAYTCEI